MSSTQPVGAMRALADGAYGRNPDLILRKITIKDYTEAIQCGLGFSLGGYVVSIILADDHLIVRRGLRALLETRSDFVVCAEASDGREAVELALKHKPDVAVLDVSLPFLNGIEASDTSEKDRQQRKSLSSRCTTAMSSSAKSFTPARADIFSSQRATNRSSTRSAPWRDIIRSFQSSLRNSA